MGTVSCFFKPLGLPEGELRENLYRSAVSIANYAERATESLAFVRSLSSLVQAVSVYVKVVFSMLKLTIVQMACFTAHLLSCRIAKAFKDDLITLISGIFRHIQIELFLPFYMLAGLVSPVRVYRSIANLYYCSADNHTYDKDALIQWIRILYMMRQL